MNIVIIILGVFSLVFRDVDCGKCPQKFQRIGCSDYINRSNCSFRSASKWVGGIRLYNVITETLSSAKAIVI